MEEFLSIYKKLSDNSRWRSIIFGEKKNNEIIKYDVWNDMSEILRKLPPAGKAVTTIAAAVKNDMPFYFNFLIFLFIHLFHETEK